LFKNFFMLVTTRNIMGGLNRMFGGQTAESKWKKEHSDHVNNYSKNYYETHKKSITAKRVVQRAEKRKTTYNKSLGF